MLVEVVVVDYVVVLKWVCEFIGDDMFFCLFGYCFGGFFMVVVMYYLLFDVLYDVVIFCFIWFGKLYVSLFESELEKIVVESSDEMWDVGLCFLDFIDFR